MKPLTIFYHVAALNEWKAVVNEQIYALVNSGVAEYADSIFIVVNGTELDREWVWQLKDNLLGQKCTVQPSNMAMETGETPTLLKIESYSKEHPEQAILYIHTKGVAHNKTRKRHMEDVWRWKLMRMLLSDWKRNIESLETKDVCGWNWSTESRYPQYFPGNMWFANASYIATLPDFLAYQKAYKSRAITDAKHPRFAAMFWLGLGIKRIEHKAHVESLEIANKSFHTYFSDLYIRKARTSEFVKEREAFDCLLSFLGDDEKLLNSVGYLKTLLPKNT